MLGQVDIIRGTNSYYKLQILEADSNKSYYVFRSWGRVGTTIGGTKSQVSQFFTAVANFEGIHCSVCSERGSFIAVFVVRGSFIAVFVVREALSLQFHGASKDSAKSEFTSVYLDKTGNRWEHRNNFVKTPGKFYPLEIDYGQQEDSALLSSVAGSNSKLAPEVQDLIKMIFDVESMKKTLLEFEVSYLRRIVSIVYTDL